MVGSLCFYALFSLVVRIYRCFFGNKNIDSRTGFFMGFTRFFQAKKTSQEAFFKPEKRAFAKLGVLIGFGIGAFVIQMPWELMTLFLGGLLLAFGLRSIEFFPHQKAIFLAWMIVWGSVFRESCLLVLGLFLPLFCGNNTGCPLSRKYRCGGYFGVSLGGQY